VRSLTHLFCDIIPFQTSTALACHITVNDDELDAVIATAQDIAVHKQCVTTDDVSGLISELNEFHTALEQRCENVQKTMEQFISTPVPTVPAPHQIILNDDELEAIISTAQDVAVHKQCTTDDVSGLLSELNGFQTALKERCQNVQTTVAQLETFKKNEVLKTSEPRRILQDFLRVFDSGTAYGYGTEAA